MENTLIHEKKEGKYYYCRKEKIFIFQMFMIKLRNWIILFKFAWLLVMHDGVKLSQVGKLSLAEFLQGR